MNVPFSFSSISFLRARLKPVVAVDTARVEKLLADLGSEKFAIRQAASKELAQMGKQVKGPIKRVLKCDLPLETRQRLAQVLRDAIGEVPPQETLRTLRTIMVLERIRTSGAGDILDAIGGGAQGAWETEEVSAALGRHRKRS
jgi:hypothetical protein